MTRTWSLYGATTMKSSTVSALFLALLVGPRGSDQPANFGGDQVGFLRRLGAVAVVVGRKPAQPGSQYGGLLLAAGMAGQAPS